jgi:hypothetical protein
VRQEGANFIATELLAAAYSRRGIRANTRAIADELAIFAMHVESKRESINGRQMRGFWVPSLGECRSVWARVKRLDNCWPGDDGEWINTYRNDEPFF